MDASAPVDHRALAEALRRRTLEGPGETPAIDRRAAAASARGEPGLATPFDQLAVQIGQAAHRVTDEQVAEVVAAYGSQKAAFEIIAAAALGAGLMRWQKAIAVLDEAAP